jgi:hypothetical protein
MKKIIFTAVVFFTCLATVSANKDIKGTYNGTKSGPNGGIVVKCIRSNFTCIVVTRVDDGVGFIATTHDKDGSIIDSYAISDYMETENTDSIEVELIP